MFILGYAIIHLPGFFRGCYLAIRKFVEQREETRKENNRQSQILNTDLEQAGIQIEEEIEKTEIQIKKIRKLKNVIHGQLTKIY